MNNESSDPISNLKIQNDQRILMLVMDGLGGLPRSEDGLTELEAARTPNLDILACEGECGLHLPIDYGITPGSAPGHLALFGYDPLQLSIGRGIVAALGVGYPISKGDVAARLNFATRNDQGVIIDRRAGRIHTKLCAHLSARLDRIKLPDIEIDVRPVRDYRAVLVLKGTGLSGQVSDTDPQTTGTPSLKPMAIKPEAEITSKLVETFIDRARELLAGEKQANDVLLRGFAQLPDIPSLGGKFALRSVALAVYPDYKGISRLVGMKVVDGLSDLSDQGVALAEVWPQNDFFFLHHKYTDSAGEDGDFDAKVAEIEKIDAFLPELLKHKPDAIVITGDHSTPSTLKSHSSHPVPFLISAKQARSDNVKKFGERSCTNGSWGLVPGRALLRIALGYTGKTARYGA